MDATVRVIVRSQCDCGMGSTNICSDWWPHEGLVACSKPLCMIGCLKHRHAPGSMGYAILSGATTWQGDDPDEAGTISWLKAWWRRTFWSAQRRAQQAWDEVKASFPPPAPYPNFTLQVGKRIFVAVGEEMIEWTED